MIYGIGAEVVFDEDPEDLLVLGDVLFESELDVDAGGAHHEIQFDFASLLHFRLVLAALKREPALQSHHRHHLSISNEITRPI